MAKQGLQELTIKNNFMFGAVMLNPENCKGIIERILGIPIERVEVDREKCIVYHPKYKGIRFDAYGKDVNNTRYGIEMQVRSQTALHKRARYYGSQMDMDILLAGTSYKKLPNTYIIFICDFDPFGENLYCYTQDKVCKERPKLSMDDGAHVMFLSTKGTNKDEVSPELLKLLEYVEKPTDESCKDDDAFIRALKESVRKVKVDREMGALYMIWEEELEDAFAEGKAEGKAEQLLEKITLKRVKGESVEQIAEALEESVDTVNELIKKYL